MRPMKLNVLGKGVATDKTDVAELVSRLDRYLAGNRKAFAPVRVPRRGGTTPCRPPALKSLLFGFRLAIFCLDAAFHISAVRALLDFLA